MHDVLTFVGFAVSQISFFLVQLSCKGSEPWEGIQTSRMSYPLIHCLNIWHTRVNVWYAVSRHISR